MNLPNLSKPVNRNQVVNESKPNHVNPSGRNCKICMVGCSMLVGTAQQLCQTACNATVC